MIEEPYYVSKEAFEKLKEKLDFLKNVERRRIANKIKEAMSLGDLSENSEYQAAKEEQALNESKIAELEDLLRRAVFIKKSKDNSMVSVGSKVEVEKSGKKFNFTIVGPAESDPENGFISNESLLGKTLLGKKKGETVSIKLPNDQEIKYKIIDISSGS